MGKMKAIYLLGLLALLFPVFALAATENTVPVADLTKVGEVLIVILVLSVVFEVALTPVFNWRFFLKHAEGKGWKTPIVIGTALLVFWSYDLDIIRDLLIALDQDATLTFGGQILTALLIAGGSDGVFRIFTKLNIRNPVERKEKAILARAEMANTAPTQVPNVANAAAAGADPGSVVTHAAAPTPAHTVPAQTPPVSQH